MIVVGLCFDNSAGDPTSVTWGGIPLRLKIKRENNVAGMTTALFLRRRVRNGGNNDIVVTWPGNIQARAMFVTVLRGVNSVDDASGNIENPATTDPVTGTTTVLEFPNTFAMGVFGSEGPPSDLSGVAEIQNDGVFQPATEGQRVGTAGGGPNTNVTVQEVFLPLDSNVATQGRLVGADNNRWANLISVFGGKTFLVTVSGTFTGEVFIEAETAEEASEEALVLGANAEKDLDLTGVNVTSVDSTVEQVFGIDFTL
jgi:hypothetical protein